MAAPGIKCQPLLFLAVAADVGTPDQVRKRVYGDKANWIAQKPGSNYLTDYDLGKQQARAAADAHRRRG
jgi:hypothetical protein